MASSVTCALCHQIAGHSEGDLLHAQLGGAYRRRIAMENATAVVIPSLGPLTFGHVLVCPIRHTRSIAECQSDEFVGVQRLAAMATAELTRLTAQPVHGFEHGNATGKQRIACSVEHAHLHLLPSGVNVVNELTSLGGWAPVDIAQSPLVVSRGREYLLYRPPGRVECWVRVTPDGEQVASQLLRRIFAAALGRAGRWNWREHPDIICAHRTYLALARRDSLALG